MRTRAPRSGLRALAPFVVAGTLALTASAATGFEPAGPASIPDTAFQTIDLPPAPPGEPAAAGQPRLPEASRAPGPTANDAVLLEPRFATAPPERAQPSIEAADPIVVVVPTPTPKTSHALRGAASWYCRAGVSVCTSGYPDGGAFDAYAAAGPGLRAALGDWRGRIVYVDGIRVRLVDWCQCYEGEPNEKLLDLYYDVFARTGSSVTVRW